MDDDHDSGGEWGLVIAVIAGVLALLLLVAAGGAAWFLFSASHVEIRHQEDAAPAVIEVEKEQVLPPPGDRPREQMPVDEKKGH